MTIELRKIVIRKPPEELQAWQFYEVVYKGEAGEDLWYGTVWLPKDGEVAQAWSFQDDSD